MRCKIGHLRNYYYKKQKSMEKIGESIENQRVDKLIEDEIKYN